MSSEKQPSLVRSALVLRSVIGLELGPAEQFCTSHGFRVRTVEIDGKAMITTRDYRTDRVNLTITRGIVSSARIG